MGSNVMFGLTTVLLLGIVAQWIAWRFRLPSIILLLLFGFVVGPFTGLIDPDALFGHLLSPFVSLSVGLILFEGGLSLRFRELPGVRRVIFSLISLGMLVTWLVTTYAARYFLELDFTLSVLLGAILTVSGPTVIIPILRDIRPKPQLSSILKWEGILIDPVGALVAVLIFEAIILGDFNHAPAFIAHGILKTVLIGGLIGTLGAALLIFLIQRYLIPDYLQNPFSLSLVITVFVLSDHFQGESGLFAVTLMGIIVANKSSVAVRHIVEFKENLQVLLIGILFVLLSARLEWSQIQDIGWNGLIFLAFIVLVARPLAVLTSTIGSELTWSERAFLAWVAPRGIVAAAVSSLFAIELHEAGVPQAELLISYTFLVIVGAGLIYGTTSGLVAKFLGVKQGQPQGVLFVGSHALARNLAKKIQELGFRVLLVDTNWTNVSVAKLEGLPTHYGNILSEHVVEDLNLDGIGRLFALTPNDEANSLAALRFAEHFGRANVFQLPHDSVKEGVSETKHPKHLRGRFLFGKEEDYFLLEKQIDEGAVIKTINISEEFSYDSIRETYPKLFIPVILVEQDTFEVMSPDSLLKPKSGNKIIALVHEE